MNHDWICWSRKQAHSVCFVTLVLPSAHRATALGDHTTYIHYTASLVFARLSSLNVPFACATTRKVLKTFFTSSIPTRVFCRIQSCSPAVYCRQFLPSSCLILRFDPKPTRSHAFGAFVAPTLKYLDPGNRPVFTLLSGTQRAGAAHPNPIHLQPLTVTCVTLP